MTVLSETDISSASTFERQAHYLTTFGGPDPIQKLEVWDQATFAAQAEMLDEIHAMLRHLCGIKGE